MRSSAVLQCWAADGHFRWREGKQRWVLKRLAARQDVLKYVTLRWSILKGNYVHTVTSGLPGLASS